MRFTYQTGAQPLAGYTIQRGIHRGGFGEVYFANSDGGKEVALKLLHHEDQDVEIRGVTQCLNLKHPNLINLFDVKLDDQGDTWVVMEYVAGSSLEDVLTSFPSGLPLHEVRDWLNGLVAGVNFLHERGIVHRDLKPANVYREGGLVKIGDVGLSKRVDSDRRRQHTQSVGTIYYMAPEVARGQYGPEVDIYSLGVMLYEMITGKLPFDGETTAEILMKHLTAQPDLSPIPVALRPTLARALEKDPQKRTASAGQLEREFLKAINSGEPLTIPESSFIPASSPPPIPNNGHARASASPGADPATAPQPPQATQQRNRLNWMQDAISAQLESELDQLKRQHRSNSTRNAVVKRSMLWLVAAVLFAFVVSAAIAFPVRSGQSVSVSFAPLNRQTDQPREELRYAQQHRQEIRRANQNHVPSIPWETWLPFAPPTKSSGRLAWILAGMAVIGVLIATSVRRIRSSAKLDAVPNGAATAPPVRVTKSEWMAGNGSRRPGRESSSAVIRPLGERLPDLANSITFAAVVGTLLSIAVFSALDAFGEARAIPKAFPHTVNIVLFAATSVVGACLVILGHFLTFNVPKSDQLHWFARLFVGALIGICAYGLDQFLVIDFSNNLPIRYLYPSQSLVSSIGKQPLVETAGGPTLLGYVWFFMVWLSVRNWSRDADPYRKRRFSVWSTAAAVVMGFLSSVIFKFPQVYAMLWAGTISTTVQLASAWIPQRLSFDIPNQPRLIPFASATRQHGR